MSLFLSIEMAQFSFENLPALQGMSEIDTSTLDHIIHLTPPGSLCEVTRQFQELGFKVIPGGVHASGLTENALVVFEDGVYLELASFVYPRSHYPDGSDEQKRYDKHGWSSKSAGWIDYSFLGTGTHEPSLSRLINERSKQGGGEELFEPELGGGRTRSDGQLVKWVVSGRLVRQGTIPFFSGDVTPRQIRVPTDPSSNTEHPSTAQGIKFIRILAHASAMQEIVKDMTAVIGKPPVSSEAGKAIWELNTPARTSFSPPHLILSTPTSPDEHEFLSRTPGIYEVGFQVREVKDNAPSATPYGRINWGTD